MLTALAAAIGALSLLWRRPLALALLVVPALVAGVALVVLGQPIRPRFFFFVAGAAAIFAGRGVGALAERFARPHQSTASHRWSRGRARGFLSGRAAAQLSRAEAGL